MQYNENQRRKQKTTTSKPANFWFRLKKKQCEAIDSRQQLVTTQSQESIANKIKLKQKKWRGHKIEMQTTT